MTHTTRCTVCGADESEALLGAFMRFVGGRAYTPLIECRNADECWRRKAQNEKSGLTADDDQAA